jgi:diguanylate cyclase
LMVASVLLLHFLGMAAFTVEPMQGVKVGADSAAFGAMGLAIFTAALVVIGTGLSTTLIDARLKANSMEELRMMALRDQMTGLPNRADFKQQFDRILAEEAGRRSVAVIGMDLNRFKEINDAWGPCRRRPGALHACQAHCALRDGGRICGANGRRRILCGAAVPAPRETRKVS